jgi:hypothetical protein
MYSNYPAPYFHPGNDLMNIASLSRLVCLVLLGCCPVALHAQGKSEWEPLRASGTIKNVVRGGITIATSEGELWNVQLPRQLKDINYSATADVDFLKPGMPIRFSAMVNNKGAVVSEVAALTVFTPLVETDIGIIPEGGGAPNPADTLFADAKEEKKTPKAPEQVSCYVGGQLVSIKGKKMIVSVGGTQVKCDLAENAQVKISVSDLTYVQPGDKADVEGRYYAGRKDLGAMANNVSITAANPLIDLKKKIKTTEPKKVEQTEKTE